MRYKTSEFILDPPEADMLEVPLSKTYHLNEADLLMSAIQFAGSALAKCAIEDFEAMRQDCEDIGAVFNVFDDVDTQVRNLFTMNIMVSCMIDNPV